MPITSPAFYLLIMGWLICFAYVLAPSKDWQIARLNVVLEALRGMLAITIVIGHALISYFYFVTGKWTAPPSTFYQFVGTGSVVLFFFLSGYLLWSKCISERGLGTAKAFYLARFRRLAPAYYAATAIVLVIALMHTGLSLRVNPAELVRELIGWTVFTIPGLEPPLNGFRKTYLINASVLWTLQLEIAFYLFLPLLNLIFKGARVFLFVAATGATFLMLDRSHTGPASLLYTIGLFCTRFLGLGFGLGMVAAFLKSRSNPTIENTLKQKRWSVVGILFVLLPVVLQVPEYSPWEFACLFVPFLLAVAGNDFFGLFNSRALFFIGTISYSSYLTHGIVLYSATWFLNRLTPIRDFSASQFWVFCGCYGMLAILFARLLYRTVEFPFLKRDSRRRDTSVSASARALAHTPQEAGSPSSRLSAFAPVPLPADEKQGSPL